ncbi:hypothetical protein L596_029053 [Steinernema carpocapsae]|uniref:Uncharacterized protein n=1 Tax=Steinernema carpocapsae TaxID=34508 RepID=A0A4U5LTH8_STECR|nr:hypothetical protein L596_029053 [Steinernema carpocapsae]
MCAFTRTAQLTVWLQTKATVKRSEKANRTLGLTVTRVDCLLNVSNPFLYKNLTTARFDRQTSGGSPLNFLTVSNAPIFSLTSLSDSLSLSFSSRTALSVLHKILKEVDRIARP